MHNSKERYDAPKCHKDTREAIIKDITSWVSDDYKDSLILWISAPAGSGKSAILQTIAELFHASKGLIASFFFSRTAPQRQSETHLVATIAMQLANSIPSTKPFIEQVVLNDLSIFDKMLPVQMELLIVQPLIRASLQGECNSLWPSLLIIDGLDECTGGKVQASLLYMLNQALLQLKSSLPRLYLLISSRPEPAICDVFEDKLSTITHHLVLDDSYNPDRDIATFLRSSFADIYHRRHTRFRSMSSLTLPWPSKNVISFLVKKSSGQFIFAATVIRFIDEDGKLPTSQLELVLDISKSLDASLHETNPFVLLDQLYSYVLLSSKTKDRVLSVIGAIFYLEDKQTLSLDFLESLLGLGPEGMVSLFWHLHSIIHVPVSRGDPIHFYHASFRDFLVDQHRSGDLHINEHAAHSLLLKSCMHLLSADPVPQQGSGGALTYSRTSWSIHYSRGNSIKPESLDSLLSTFIPSEHLDSTALTKLAYWWSIYGQVRSDWHDQVSTQLFSDGSLALNGVFCSALRIAPHNAAA